MTPRLACTSLIATACLSVFAAGAQAAPFVLAYADGQVPSAYTNLQQFSSSLSAVGLGSTWSLRSDGTISSEGMTSTTQSIIAFSKSRGLPLYPTVSDFSNDTGSFDAAVSNGILATSASRASAVANLVKLATANGFAGVDVDLEAVQPAGKANFTAFLSSLSSALHVYGLKLVVSVPAKTSDNGASYLAGYDYAGIGSAVDYVQVMTYDEVGPGWSSDAGNGNTWPGPESGLDWQRQVLTYALSRLPSTKLLSGLPAYGYDYSTGQQVHWADFQKTISAHAGAVRGRDSAAATPWASWGTVKQQADGKDWSSASKQPVLWYDDAQSVQAKAALVASLGLAGTSVWAMGYEDASFWTALKSGLGSATTPDTLQVVATANAGGHITPSGTVSVVQGDNVTFGIQPSAGYDIGAVTVDGHAVGAVSTYTFGNVQAQHTIAASFAAASTGVGNIERSGTGYVWAKNTTATANGNRSTRAAVNDGVTSAGSAINADGENGLVRWEAAGVLWDSPRTVTRVQFVNGKIDSDGNGYFQGHVDLQFTTDGSTWKTAGWAPVPAYPDTASAGGATFSFAGAATSGILGVRVVGTTSSESWSAAINEVMVVGR
jgi:spore germination protein YaaH